MKIKVTEATYEEAMREAVKEYRNPPNSSLLLRTLVRLYSIPELRSVGFTYTKEGMERLGRKEPCLILMNHSSFIDLEIASRILYPKPFHIVCTSDGFVGKEDIMRRLGCIPTKKFVAEMRLLRDMRYALETCRSSVLMYPEASYSFDGTATPLPESLGKCLKLLKVPVVTILTEGAFARDPLYNNLQKRKVKVSAKVKYLLSPEDIAERSVEELNEILKKEFTFDNFRWQQENHVRISEQFRADFLNRVLYKCPHCLTEGQMEGKGTALTCRVCGSTYSLTGYGSLEQVDPANGNSGIFTHVPDWYRWERECVREELQNGTYHLEVPVDICMLTNLKTLYRVGEGVLTHTEDGFHLTGCGGALDYRQKPLASYSLYSDYYWYELGDMICIGNPDVLYYCFPKNSGDIVAKTRLAAEELYKIKKEEKKSKISL
ncbi:1-acyl-sn-glycerol-3-phosphate acyltransferase [Lachnospiraceae bacterium CLA-AA-H215]|uniref:1-acyl-sn-glycerol-3-phosphate acyltransferase n=1 Tax=Hominifimenecus microfluidus TaxID=2885348 RepID=A0AAE3EAS8_9FIRM|nr:lysophospholipid acyltransferase family protein [Hominifimenecus microfluidus]MCC2231283.1 1-acyl-sn-glycerol-3-phosphate acyltransferase [Hominifimenecus microfluidus]